MNTTIRPSLYWDSFAERMEETVSCLKVGITPPVRRVAVFITEGCNFRCSYCNIAQTPKTLTKYQFEEIVAKYGETAIIHITGGEPSIVPWLYPYLAANGDKYRFHLNTNAYIAPPARSIKRLKVSLDSCFRHYWNDLVGRNAFDSVVDNIKAASLETVTSITYTLTHENYRTAIDFVDFANKEFPDIYALFFSVYKGTNTRFVFTPEDVEYFFNRTVPQLQAVLHPESLALLCETLDNKERLIAGVRFPENDLAEPCYLAMSERVIGPDGVESHCSHLYRDGIKSNETCKHTACQYGCNRRLVQFNNLVSRAVNE